MTGRPDLHVAPASTGDGEDAAARILALYRELLRREPGAAELAHWRNQSLRGMPLSEIRAVLLECDEYRERTAAAEYRTTVANSGLFDADWYLTANRDVADAGLNALDHYCRFGAAENRSPNAWFHPVDYRARAALDPGEDALLDYLNRGEQRGIAPGPHFDPAWYRATYRLAGAVSPLAHFLSHRASGRFAPCPALWSVAQSGMPGTPDLFLPFIASEQDHASLAAADIALLRASGLFDDNHYRILNEDVFSAGMDLLTHYCVFGWKEGRSPNLYFDSRWYVATNPDVERLRVNPLVHYLLAGEAADRRPVAYFEPGWYRRTYGLPDNVSSLAHYLAHRRTQRFSPNSLFDPAWYRTQCGNPPRGRRDLFAHYLVTGMHADIRPSAGFDAAAWRRQTSGRPSKHFPQAKSLERDNPLVNYMLAQYR